MRCVRPDIFLDCLVAITLARIPVFALLPHVPEERLAWNIRDSPHSMSLQEILIGRVNGKGETARHLLHHIEMFRSVITQLHYKINFRGVTRSSHCLPSSLVSQI